MAPKSLILLWNVCKRRKRRKTVHMKTETPRPPALQRALALREEGKSQRAIAFLAAEGVPRPPGRGKSWSQKAVERLFRRFEEAPQASRSPAPAAPPPRGVARTVPRPLRGAAPRPRPGRGRGRALFYLRPARTGVPAVSAGVERTDRGAAEGGQQAAPGEVTRA